MIVINVQRGGPSTGRPTKTEQADLFQAMFGRNGECPMPVIAASSPAECFEVAQEAWRLRAWYAEQPFSIEDWVADSPMVVLTSTSPDRSQDRTTPDVG